MVKLSTLNALLALPALSLVLSSPLLESTDSAQLPLTNLLSSSASEQHEVHPSIFAALDKHDDPVDALLSLKPELEDMMAERRLLRIFGEGPREGVWMTEGDKLRLRREGKKFMDLTESQDMLESKFMAGKANTPELTHQRYIRPIFRDLSTSHMHDVLTKATSFFNRYYHAETGVQSARWLHDHIASIIAASPIGEFISLEYHTHRFPQPSIIARFEPPTRNASLPLTIIGAHQDSANYLFPLLPAPGADDDMSGSTSILEAFRALANRGYIPQRGPVEFHWYAAEEAGLLGSQEIVAYKRGLHANVGAMIEFDMTAFVARNTTPHIFLLENDADDNLTKWVVKLAKEYVDIPVNTSSLGAGAGSDYMSWTQGGYPAAFAAEGDPLSGGFPGDFDGYIHTDMDKMDIDDETGYFSLEHMLEFSKLAIAFAVEQAGWSDKHTRGDDNKRSAW
ncbi:hypothetical protein I302_100024 [Kwoniella bestiolae CBS 10118]|uniref:Peptide hydrolase n=1 Tax=Kwoniella bestiolae CBS 10118 TaxID=1296100 RepID=A0A1B9G3Y2_9TREE|nr:hypothetical protein I302_03396 [Kwoniella bestiolae CBS 10118]OCF25723.1 hypothetical protein I302_03396 [Kwoniella bestiolae CBS 10118]